MKKDNNGSNLSNLFPNSSILLAKKILLTKYITNFQDNWVANISSKRDNNQNNLDIRDDNIDADIIKNWAKKIKINYN